MLPSNSSKVKISKVPQYDGKPSYCRKLVDAIKCVHLAGSPDSCLFLFISWFKNVEFQIYICFLLELIHCASSRQIWRWELQLRLTQCCLNNKCKIYGKSYTKKWLNVFMEYGLLPYKVIITKFKWYDKKIYVYTQWPSDTSRRYWHIKYQYYTQLCQVGDLVLYPESVRNIIHNYVT